MNYKSNETSCCLSYITHTIQPQDTLYSLSLLYNTTVDQLLCMNPGIDPYNLQIGTILAICPASPVMHIIKQGDTLYSLARQHNTTVEALLCLNPGIDPYNLQIGSSIVLFPQHQIVHIIEQGDTLYSLAKYHNTTVEALLCLNPGIDIYNLQIGSSLMICPGKEMKPPITPMPPIYPLPPIEPMPPIYPLPPVAPIPPIAPPTPPIFPPMPPVMPNPDGIITAICRRILNLFGDMRMAWEQHVYWTRLFLISTADRLPDQATTTKRLLENPKDIANIFARYYSPAIAAAIEKLLTEHLQIGGDLITALRDNQTAKAKQLQAAWYKNADDMAHAFAAINPHYKYDELRKMLYKHLDLTSKEVSDHLSKKFADEVKTFDEIEKEALMMADYFVDGIIKEKRL